MSKPEEGVHRKKALRRALGHLSRPHAYIPQAALSCSGPRGDGVSVDVLQIRSQNDVRTIGEIDGVVSREMLEQGLISLNGDRWRITRAGRYCHKRQLAPSDPFQAQHQERGVTAIRREGQTESVVTNDAESPLAWLRKRRCKNGRPLVSDAQFEAGERLRADFYFAQMSPRVTANWNGQVNARRGQRQAISGSDIADHVLAAKARVADVLTAVGPELSDVLIDVCCHMKGLEATEKARGWPQRSGKIVLSLALSSLARHYGLLGDVRPAERRSEFGHWGSSDFRPTLDSWQ